MFRPMQEGRGDWTHGWQTLNSKPGKHKVGSDFPKKTWKKNQMARAHSSRHLDFLERKIEKTIGAIELALEFCLWNPTFQVYGLHKPSKRHKDRLLACAKTLCAKFWIDFCDLRIFVFFFVQFFGHKSPIAGLACGCRQGDLCVQGRCWCQSRGLQ